VNPVKRARLKDVITHLENLNEIISEIRDEEQEAFDALSDSLQSSPNGLEMEEAIDVLDPIVDNLEEAISNLESFLAGGREDAK
jgi:hypothetical protein